MIEQHVFVNKVNKEAVLGLIRHAPEGVSRAQIAEQLGVSRATISSIVDRLISSGVVVERGAGISRGGRKPIVLEINPTAGLIVGIDMGATHLNTIITNLRGQVQASAESNLDIDVGPQAGLASVRELVQHTLSKAGLVWSAVWAVGMGVPGPVVTTRGMVSSPPIMPGWDGFPIREHLEAYWHKPTFVDNDADLGALGEGTFGAGRGQPNLAYIKIGTGIGCGILLDGKIYHGVLGTAGEIGHVTVSQDGPPCKCGNYGCLEAMASGRAIAQRARMAVQANQPTTLAALNHGHQLTARDVSRAAQAGDAVSQQLLSDAGRHIGSALASLVNLLNPGLIIIGGRVAEAGVYILDPIREAVKQRSLRASYDATRILPAALGEQSVAMGAVALALENGLRAVLYADKLRARQLRPRLST